MGYSKMSGSKWRTEGHLREIEQLLEGVGEGEDGVPGLGAKWTTAGAHTKEEPKGWDCNSLDSPAKE